MVNFKYKDIYTFDDLIEVLRILRGPEGCPWDQVQTHASNRRNFLEEAYEAVEGFDKDDPALMCEELGDMLMQVLFNIHIEEDAGRFNLTDVTDQVCKKLIFRHPHVFGTVSVSGEEEVLVNWEQLKREEKGQRTTFDACDSVARSLPALIRAEKLNSKLMKMGYAWSDPAAAVEYARSALSDLPHADDPVKALGSALFALTGACKAMELEAEEALHAAAQDVIARFSAAEECGTGTQSKEICQFLP